MRKVLLTGACGAVNDDPAYSCDGAHVSSDQDIGPSAPSVHRIFIANADGSGAHRLPTGPRTKDAYDTQSQWSPDGKRLAWTRVSHSTPQGSPSIDGTGPRHLTPWNLDAANPDSPHGIRQARLSRASLKDVMSSPLTENVQASSAQARTIAAQVVQTVELEEALSEHRNGT